MAEIKTEQEPSIEEILESIRQIISEDGTPAPAAEPAPQLVAKTKPVAPPPPAPAAPKPAPAPVAAAPRQAPAAPASAADAILDLTEKVVVEPDPDQPEHPVHNARVAMEAIMDDENLVFGEEHLVSENTADAAVASLARLLSNNMALERELPGKPGPVTLEDMTRELMRPLIKQWLDQNLQKIIEKMVAREIERLSLRAMDK
ncbi:MAG: DUF2497 domain-containing protein [Micavibrio sp.]|nr:DUF2497 domain-containing protein [Micavibrio sp.]